MKDRLQLRFDHYTGYTSKDEIRDRLEELRSDPINPLPWALKGEPIVFFYKGEEDSGYTAVLAIGVNGDGETASRENDYFLIDTTELRKDIEEVSGQTEESVSAITAIKEFIDNVVGSLGLEENGEINFHKHHAPNFNDLGDMYPGLTNVFDLLEEMAKDVKGNLNEDLRLEYEDGIISIYNGNSSTPISSIDASDFIADGFLSSVTIVSVETQEQYDPEGYEMVPRYGYDELGNVKEDDFPYLMFVWNNESLEHHDITRVGLHKIMNPYKAGNGLDLAGNTFSIKINENSENFLSVDGNGLKISGVMNAVETAAAAAKTVVTDDGLNRFVTVSSRTDSDGHSIYIIKENDIASASELEEEKDNRITADSLINNKVASLETNLSNEIENRTNLTNILEQSAITLENSIREEALKRDTDDRALSADTHDLKTKLEQLSGVTSSEIARSTAKDTAIDSSINEINGDIDALDARIDTLEAHEISDVDPSDKMLSIANGLIASTFRVEYDNVEKRIEFFGKNDSLLGFVSTSDFVIDGMIDTVSVVTVEGVNYLRFVFNTDAGKQNIDINLTDLVTEYTIAEDSKPYLYISGFTIGVKINTTDRSGLATENDIHDIQDIIGDGFNTETEQHTLTQKIRHIEETLEEMPTAAELDTAIEDLEKIKNVIAVQLKTKVVNPSANLKLSFFGAPASDYIMVGTSIQPVININYSDGKYISANGSEMLAGCEVNPNSEKTLKLNGEAIGTLSINQDSPVITIQDGEYSASAHVNYLEGSAMPTDAFGEPNESIRIPAGSIDCETEKVIKAFRPIYFGPFDPDSLSEVNAVTLNAMISNRPDPEFTPLTTYGWPKEKDYVTVPDGTKAFAVIVPVDGDRFVGGEVRAILDNKDHGFNIIDQFETFNLPNVRTYTGDTVGFPYKAYVYQPATEMEESYFKVIY